MIIEFDIKKFTEEVNALCEQDIDYLDAVLQWCQINDVEVEIVAVNIKKSPEHKTRMTDIAKKKFLLKA